MLNMLVMAMIGVRFLSSVLTHCSCEYNRFRALVDLRLAIERSFPAGRWRNFLLSPKFRKAIEKAQVPAKPDPQSIGRLLREKRKFERSFGERTDDR
jgi:hypothetical protein